MSKLWLVAANELTTMVFKKSFVISLLSVPVIILFMVGFALLVDAARDDDTERVGYVDHADVLVDSVPSSISNTYDNPVTFIRYPSEEAASSALELEIIRAYYVLPDNYLETRNAELVHTNSAQFSDHIARKFTDFVRVNLLSDYPDDITHRAITGVNLIIRTPDGQREFTGDPTLNQLLPLFMSFALLMLIFTSSGYLTGTVSKEKVNRTMEILVTSISTGQLIWGKLLGIIAVSLMQFVAWVVFAALVIAVGGGALGLEWFQNPEIEIGTILTVLAIFLPAYIMAAGLMVTASASLLGEDGGQVAQILLMVILMIPTMLAIIIQSPNSTLAVMLSLMPLISLPTVGMRTIFTVVPAWQIAACIVIHSVCAVGALWLAGKAFRLGVLRYGQRLHLRDFFGEASLRRLS